MFRSTQRSRRPRRLVAALTVVGLALAATACQTMPTEGRYSAQLYTDAQLTTITDLEYGTAVNYQGTTVSLKIDLYLPPDDGPHPRPVVVAIHGGGFTGGNKSQMASTARSYARRGFAAASISYRLDPRASTSEAYLLAAALNGIDDGMESVRWLRSRAATYNLDTTRIAMVGSSAGGAVAMGVAVHDDPTPTGPLSSFSPTIRAAVSTGVNLTPGFELGLIQGQPTDAPVYMFHYDVDTVTGQTFEYAFGTCVALSQAGATCGMTRNEGSGHTVSLTAGGTYWTDPIGPFIWKHLDLYSLTA